MGYTSHKSGGCAGWAIPLTKAVAARGGFSVVRGLWFLAVVFASTVDNSRFAKFFFRLSSFLHIFCNITNVTTTYLSLVSMH